jgi:hypothetical protein
MKNAIYEIIRSKHTMCWLSTSHIVLDNLAMLLYVCMYMRLTQEALYFLVSKLDLVVN